VSKAAQEGWKKVYLFEAARSVSYGIKPFEGVRNYVATIDLNGQEVVGGTSVSFNDRPSRADLELQIGDVIFARMKETVKVLEATNGINNYIFSTGFAGFRPSKDLNSNFLKQIFLSKKFNAQKNIFCTGTTQKAISSKGIEQIRIFLPPLPEQLKIAAILSSVDDAIEKTKAVIEQTKVVKKGLMQELLTRGIPGRPKKFKKTPVGEIPEEWDVVRLKDIAKVQTGVAKNSKKKKEKPLTLPYLRVANVQDGFVDLSEIKHIVIDKNKAERYLLQKGDVLFNEGGDNDKLGRGCVWEAKINPCAHQNHVFAARCSSRISPYYLAIFAASPIGKQFFLNAAKQTTNLASINSTQLKLFPIPLPSPEEQHKIINIIRSIDNNITAKQELLDSMQNIKTALISEGKCLKKED